MRIVRGFGQADWRGRLPLARAVALLLALSSLQPAAAHRQSAPGSTAGLAIAAVTHGQMIVLAANRAAILALADARDPADRTLQRLLAFVALQHFACGWGLFPGTEADSSPFNECRHGELAGVRAVLLRLGTIARDDARVRVLARKVEIEMLEQHAAMVLCRYSDEPFNSADVVFPNWSNALRDPASVAAGAAFALVAAAGCSLVWRRRRTTAPTTAS